MRDIYEIVDSFEDYSQVKSIPIVIGKINEPEITVFVPTYKRTDTLKQTLDSIIGQTDAQSFEILVINNSSDGEDVEELIKSYRDDRISYYINEENIGLCGNWNRGIELAKGKYVAMIHDDDLLSPWFLTAVKKAITEHKEPEIIGVSYINFDSDHFPVFKRPEAFKYRHISKESFFFGHNINIAGMTVKREFILKLGGYSEEYYPNEDTIMIYQTMVLGGRIINIEHPLAGYRRELNLSLKNETMEQIINITEQTRRFIALHEKFAQKWMKNFDREYFYHYILSANAYWGMSLDYKIIMKDNGFSSVQINKLKYWRMKMLLKIKECFFRLGA